ncbi:YaiI/YqxD family protein [Alkalibacillus salilacus]|uniref:UPF0178 protein J2S77_001378 n=1 Tax=Alkalibacillus salilacus TaxID=284582 RepID=A0ABT9VEL8_9BACI|nr:YaiI/YqxD family protein [Alkalibacillus salilacus]MDQ0159414.1 uncharacterized protein YaiI (UPF0178 family) [Alkalibacillus salilacus]
MNILIDADACPVTHETIEEALKHHIPVIMVKSFAHFSPNDQQPGVDAIYVDSESEAADYKIIQNVQKGDLVVTQDYGLASLVLGKGAHAIHHKGMVYTDDNIDGLLQSRYLNALARQSGERSKGPKAFSNENREHFTSSLQKLLDDLGHSV